MAQMDRQTDGRGLHVRGSYSLLRKYGSALQRKKCATRQHITAHTNTHQLRDAPYHSVFAQRVREVPSEPHVCKSACSTSGTDFD